MTNLKFLGFLLTLNVALAGCQPKEPNPVDVDREIQLLSDLNVAETEMDEAISLGISLFAKAQFQIKNSNDTSFRFNDCADVSLNPSEKKLVLNFGSEGCTNTNARWQKGSLTFSYNKTLFQTGSVVFIAFDQYELKRTGSNTVVKVDNNSSIRIENQSVSDSLINFKRVLNARLNFVDGSAFTWQSTRYVNWNLGSDPANRFEHRWAVSTNTISAGQSRTGLPFQSFVSTPLKFSGQCLKAGQYSPNSGNLKATSTDIVRIVDFGQDTCGGRVTVSINGLSRQLHWH